MMLARSLGQRLGLLAYRRALFQTLELPAPNVSNSLLSTRCFTSKTSYLMEKITVNVPSMGDSITEGTIVSWTVNVGQSVKEGDVLALVETDKVTVDIKAQMDGIITAHFGKQDDTVTVGEKLYEIDSDTSRTGTNGIDSKLGLEILKNEPTVDSSSQQLRVPSIKFLGKEGWTHRKSAVATATSNHGLPDISKAHTPSPTSPPSPPPSQPVITKPHHVITVQGGNIRSSFGRGRISSQEIESLLMGGASTAPNILPSNGKKKRE